MQYLEKCVMMHAGTGQGQCSIFNSGVHRHVPSPQDLVIVIWGGGGGGRTRTILETIL